VGNISENRCHVLRDVRFAVSQIVRQPDVTVGQVHRNEISLSRVRLTAVQQQTRVGSRAEPYFQSSASTEVLGQRYAEKRVLAVELGRKVFR